MSPTPAESPDADRCRHRRRRPDDRRLWRWHRDRPAVIDVIYARPLSSSRVVGPAGRTAAVEDPRERVLIEVDVVARSVVAMRVLPPADA